MAQRTWLSLLGLLIYTGLAHAQAPCDCSNVADLINRLIIAHAAIDKYRLDLKGMSQTATVDGPAPTGEGNNRDALQKAVNEAMGEVKRLGLQDFEGKTPGVTCEPVYPDASACVRAVIKAHESVHQTACKADKTNRNLGANDDRLKGQLLTVYAAEEIKGYETEIDDILKRLRAMPASCRPIGWIGSIYAIEIKLEDTTTVSQPRAQYASAHTRTVKSRRARWGAIYHDGTTRSAYWHSEHEGAVKESSGKLVNCDGGLKRRPPDRQEDNTHEVKSSGKGFSKVAPPVNLNVTVDGLYFSIGFQLPKVEGTFSGDSTWNERGGCKDETRTVKIQEGPWTFDTSDWIELRGRVAPGSRYVGGYELVDLTPPGKAGIPGVNFNDHKIEVTWHLYKVD